MAITDTQVAALRAQLAGDAEEHRRLLGNLDQHADGSSYATLLACAFSEAVERRFGLTPDRAAVVEFVGDLRARAETIRQRLSAEVAERTIMTVYGEGSVNDLDDETVTYAQVVTTTGLISDEQLSDAELDSFMAEVRSVAERLVS